ncbi:MAG: hypothetical protein MK188_11885 [Gammaproteobacteria bacterium]|nr:hypothetical protein [Gammaproteobacteria bacterium]
MRNTIIENNEVSRPVTAIGSELSKKLVTPIAVAIALAIVSLPARADNYGSYGNSYASSYDRGFNDGHNNAVYDYAKVVNVDPVYETYQVNNPVEQCYSERVRVRGHRYPGKRSSKTPEILGGIIGGAIGNQVGKRGGGKARDVATVVGAVLGGSIARDIKHSQPRHPYRNNHYRYETVQRCETQDSYSTKQELVGYHVTYKYRGKVYYGQFDEHPGNRIKVKVTVDPV